MSHCGIRNVAIYAYSSGKFLDHGKYACVKYLTNIMSASGRYLAQVRFWKMYIYKYTIIVYHCILWSFISFSWIFSKSKILENVVVDTINLSNWSLDISACGARIRSCRCRRALILQSFDRSFGCLIVSTPFQLC